MKLCVGVVIALSACAFDDEMEPAEGVVESESAPSSGQGSTMQGSTMQGSTMQGSTMQGSTMQGSTMQAGTYNGYSLSSESVSGTAISFMRYYNGRYERRSPNSICYFSSSMQFQGCTTTATGTSSPLVGSIWPTTFTKPNPDGSTSYIGVKLRIDSVRRDTSQAMFALRGSSFATGAIVDCENPNDCRVNSDIWLYAVTAIDVFDADNKPVKLCPAGESAIALAGTYNSTGNFLSSTTKFTFACTNGTIAKCTRWGYRGYDVAIKSGDSTNTSVSLRNYHQACVRAAAADYCGVGKSFTKDGTLVDIYDFAYQYGTSFPRQGFVPRISGSLMPYEDSTAFKSESVFDQFGATRIDHLRYAELENTPEYGSIEDACPGKFYLGEDTANDVDATYNRESPAYGSVSVSIASTTACSHSEFSVGKYLNPGCSRCADTAPAHCTDPAQGWTQDCVDWARHPDRTTEVWHSCHVNGRMTSHSECEVGYPLKKHATGCTLAVCLRDSTCCTPGGAWSSSCVSMANAVCRGGKESGMRGFCGSWNLGTAPPLHD